MSKRQHIVVFSGGSAANNIVDVFGNVADDRDCALSYVIPISDNGGSTSEIIRVFGGPGIGDVRSRLVRLIPSGSSEKAAIKTLFNHRLPPDPALARIEWLAITDGQHALWQHISSSKRELIRSFFNTMQLEIVKRNRPTSTFNFQTASVGNLFLTGARLFTGSFESAIDLLGMIAGVEDGVEVIPAINSNFSHHISAGLADGTVITGQNAISHPSAPSAPVSVAEPDTPRTTSRKFASELDDHDKVEDANWTGSLPTLRKQYIEFHKGATQDLPAPIERVWYISPYGQEIRPSANPKVLGRLGEASTLIYSIGSLYTSVIPCLILRGVGERIRREGIRWKILVLNGCNDRETKGYTAVDFVRGIVNACQYESSRVGEGSMDGEDDRREWKRYVTHLVHLQGEGTPRVEKEVLKGLGIETMMVYGRKNEEGEGMVYDGKALRQALDVIMGRGEGIKTPFRRMTLVG